MPQPVAAARAPAGRLDHDSGRSLDSIACAGPRRPPPPVFGAAADRPVEHLVEVLKAYRERMVDLHRDRRFRYVLIFKNHGPGAGATLEHTHTQLVATPIIPKSLMEELEGARRYYELKERCVFCD